MSWKAISHINIFLSLSLSKKVLFSMQHCSKAYSMTAGEINIKEITKAKNGYKS